VPVCLRQVACVAGFGKQTQIGQTQLPNQFRLHCQRVLARTPQPGRIGKCPHKQSAEGQQKDRGTMRRSGGCAYLRCAAFRPAQVVFASQLMCVHSLTARASGQTRLPLEWRVRAHARLGNRLSTIKFSAGLGQRRRPLKKCEVLLSCMGRPVALTAERRVAHHRVNPYAVLAPVRQCPREGRGSQPAAARTTRGSSPSRAAPLVLMACLPTTTHLASLAALHAAIGLFRLGQQHQTGAIRNQQQQEQQRHATGARRRHMVNPREPLPRLPQLLRHLTGLLLVGV